jgi:hypothetical protein
VGSYLQRTARLHFANMSQTSLGEGLRHVFHLGSASSCVHLEVRIDIRRREDDPFQIALRSCARNRSVTSTVLVSVRLGKDIEMADILYIQLCRRSSLHRQKRSRRGVHRYQDRVTWRGSHARKSGCFSSWHSRRRRYIQSFQGRSHRM